MDDEVSLFGGPPAGPSRPGGAPPAADLPAGPGAAEPDVQHGEPRPSPAHRAVPRIPGPRPALGLGIALGLGLAAAVIAVGQRESPGAAPVAASPPLAVPSAAVPSPGPVVLPGLVAPASTDVAAVRSDLRAAAVRLPTLDVRSDLIGLDLGPDGALTPPPDPDVAGWYVRSAAPGRTGPAVIAGHVDSRSGPAVFHRLDELTAGDPVEVTRSDGQVFTYRVLTVESHPKTAFPTARVYGPTPGPQLRLITCGGDFDRSSRHYLDNVVVTAVPAF